MKAEMSSAKGREFWVDPIRYRVRGIKPHEQIEGHQDFIPFVEKSALDAALAEIERLKTIQLAMKGAWDLAEQDLDAANALLDKAVKALREINDNEINAQRPGGSPSRSATISYDAVKEIEASRRGAE
jgi:hypothetical protein